MSVDSLRGSRRKAAVAFTEFTRLYKQNPSALYCFFEGEDSKYYGIRIKTIAKPKKTHYLICDGKEGVLEIQKMLLARKYYANVKAAYFIDRDFDQPISELGLEGIYETPGYSIENFYTSVECFSEILKNEFKLIESDENFQRCVSLYQKLQKEFHNAVEILNAWIACQRDKSSQLNISNLKLSKLVTINLDKITVNYAIVDLDKNFPKAVPISQEELDARREELISRSRQKSFRGKFEIDFLFAFLQKLIEKANQGSYPYFTRKVKVILSCSRKNIISQLSQYADTPDCLDLYLRAFREL